jgi:hypothetical protein
MDIGFCTFVRKDENPQPSCLSLPSAGITATTVWMLRFCLFPEDILPNSSSQLFVYRFYQQNIENTQK